VNDSRNLAPTGWHVTTNAEWTNLITYLGSESVAGGKLKEIGTEHWDSPNTGASNTIDFNGLPGGYMHSGTAGKGFCGIYGHQQKNHQIMHVLIY
jgi:uncharacterized protein (TIGR02145 family)